METQLPTVQMNEISVFIPVDLPVNPISSDIHLYFGLKTHC